MNKKPNIEDVSIILIAIGTALPVVAYTMVIIAALTNFHLSIFISVAIAIAVVSMAILFTGWFIQAKERSKK